MIIPVYLGWYGGLIELLIPGEINPVNIMFHIALAIPQAIKELVRMIEIYRQAPLDSVSCFFSHDPALVDKSGRQEEAIDLLQKEIIQYLVEISEKDLDKADSEKIPVLVHSVNDVERIGDHAENIIEPGQRKREQKLILSATALSELREVTELTDSMVENIIRTLAEEDEESARQVLQQEDRLNNLQVELKENHVKRLSNQECHILAGLVFIDLVDNLEKIGDHLTNIAQGFLRSPPAGMKTHPGGYLRPAGTFGLRWDLEPEVLRANGRP